MDLDTGLNVLVVVVPVGKVASLTVVLRTRELGVHIRPGIHQKWTHFLVVKGTAAALGPRPYMGFIRLLQQLAFLGGLFILFFSPVGSFLRPRRGFSSPHTQHTEESHVWKWGRGRGGEGCSSGHVTKSSPPLVGGNDQWQAGYRRRNWGKLY